MNKNVTVKINMKKVNKKLEKIAQKKYPPTYVPPEHSENKFAHSPSQTWYTPKNSIFVPIGYHKIKCQHCEQIIAIPMGYSNCPKCGKMVYADKNTVFLN